MIYMLFVLSFLFKFIIYMYPLEVYQESGSGV